MTRAASERSAPGNYATGNPPTRVTRRQRGGVRAASGITGRNIGVVVGGGVDDDRAPVGVQDIFELEAVGGERCLGSAVPADQEDRHVAGVARVIIAGNTQVPASGRKRWGGTPDAYSLLVDMEAVKTDGQAANLTDDVKPPVELNQLDGSERHSPRIHEAGLPASKQRASIVTRKGSADAHSQCNGKRGDQTNNGTNTLFHSLIPSWWHEARFSQAIQPGDQRRVGRFDIVEHTAPTRTGAVPAIQNRWMSPFCYINISPNTPVFGVMALCDDPRLMVSVRARMSALSQGGM
jgi:hypothetical protein